jgi:antitoxin VapB
MVQSKGKTQLATLFRNGGSQAVRLPREFQFAGDRVRVRRIRQGVLLEPLVTDPQDWFAALDAFDAEPFMPEGRSQPKTPRRKIFR